MAIDRRRFVRLALAASIFGPNCMVAAGKAQRLLSCRSDTQGCHYATLFDSDGEILLDVRLPARGHAFALSPDHRRAVVFARRPGDFMLLIDLPGCRILGQFASPSGRHFYGHGAFSADGRLLFTTENAFDSGDGRIGIYAVEHGLERIGEFASHGIGPHEIRLSHDGSQVIVANGGIRTHPDMPRAKLNLARMQPNLSYLSAHDGALIEQLAPPSRWHQLSMRHLDIAADGCVAIAMQYEGPRTDHPPLIALHHAGQALQWLRAPEDAHERMRNYCGSVAFDRAGQTFAVSSPRGKLVTLWSRTGAFLGTHEQADSCGVTAFKRGFLASDGHGGLTQLDRNAASVRSIRFDDTRWDNHLAVV